MADFGSMVGSIEKLNEYNYRDWRTCIKFYLKGQDLWEIVDGRETTPPHIDDKKYNSWIVKASKAMYIIMTTIDKSLRARIEDAETPKEAWDILASLFSRRNPARLQLLERELMNTGQGTLSINEYFLKVKNLCREVEQLDAEAKFGDARIRRIIINGLRPEYNSFIMALQGWEKQPSLVELENLLANQEALEQQMSKVTIKPETEEALFSARRPRQWSKKGDHERKHDKGRFNHKGRISSSEDEEDSDKEERRQREHRQPRRVECFVCGRNGHYARDCKLLKKIQSNFAKMEHMNDPEEEEWDFEATYAVEEDIEKEFDFEAPYTVDEDVTEEEWDVSEGNGELWTEELEGEENMELAASSIIMEPISDHHDREEGIEVEENTHDHNIQKFTEPGLGQENMKLKTTQSGMINFYKDYMENFEWQGADKQEEQIRAKVLTNNRSQEKIDIHSKENRSDHVKQDKFDIGANMKRPPDEEDQLDIKGEY